MNATTLTAAMLHTVSPAAMERAHRLDCAIRLVRQGHTRREVSGMVRRQFGISPVTAWRLSHMAWDLAGAVA